MPSYSQSGFALPLTLIILALLTALSLGLSRLTSANSLLIQENQLIWEEELQVSNLTEQLVYLMLTGQYDQVGVGNETRYLPLNDSPITIGERQVQVQSWAGLYGLELLSDKQIFSVLRQQYGSEQGQLIAAQLSDWLDQDDLRRFQGYEAADYRSGGLKQRPRNGSMRSIDELLELPAVTADVMGSKDAPGLRDLLLVGGEDNFDLGTAPDVLIGPLLGLSPATAKEVISARQTGDWDKILFLIDEYHWAFNDHPPFYKGQHYRVRIEGPAGTLSRVQLALTPFDTDGLYELMEWQVPDYGY